MELTLLEERFRDLKSAVKEGLDDLKSTTQRGFDALLRELQSSREQGHIPVSLMKDMLAAQNEAFRENRKSSDAAYSKILSQYGLILGGLIAWFTGMYVYARPDKTEAHKEKQTVQVEVPVAPVAVSPEGVTK
jgi:hypothetical protein